jgi:hypothetical protein
MKRLFLSALASLALLSAAPQAAQAQSLCYLETPQQQLGTGATVGCRVSSRYNANGHLVYDVSWVGRRTSYLLWDDGSAEIFFPERRTGTWRARRFSDGFVYAVILHHNQSVTAFPMYESKPTTAPHGALASALTATPA